MKVKPMTDPKQIMYTMLILSFMTFGAIACFAGSVIYVYKTEFETMRVASQWIVNGVPTCLPEDSELYD